ncbi:uncharacterized protein [Hyperolius riggenbachi]|uniref:uncharacterized protein isoform X2 n=1 Tax=Hyperolius riggenbachi TaxID=752182 RepID=UPI0035A320B4
MRSQQVLVLLCVLKAAMSAASLDLYAAVGGRIVIPQETRLEHSTGTLCNPYTWRYEKEPGVGLKEIAQVTHVCGKTDCRWPHCSLTSNGSLQLEQVTQNDSGHYTVTTYSTAKVQIQERTFVLHVLVPVSHPMVGLACPPGRDPVVTCSVKGGTTPRTLLRINGVEHGQKAERSDMEVTVPSPAPWNISCSTENKVSQKTARVFYKACPDPVSRPAVEYLCTPDGSVEISCTVQAGTDPVFSLTVNGVTWGSNVTSSWVISGDDLERSLENPLNVSCMAWNLLNQVQSPYQLIQCPALTGSLSVSSAALRKQLGVCHIYVTIFLFVFYNLLLVWSVAWERRRRRPSA